MSQCMVVHAAYAFCCWRDYCHSLVSCKHCGRLLHCVILEHIDVCHVQPTDQSLNHMHEQQMQGKNCWAFVGAGQSVEQRVVC